MLCLHRLSRRTSVVHVHWCAPASFIAIRHCSGGVSPGATGDGTGTKNPFASSIAKTLREKVFTPDFGTVKADATVKEAELLRKWRDGDGTPEQSPLQPDIPGTADGSDVTPARAEGSRDVAGTFGHTFRDQRPIDPNETMEDKRRRLIYQSRYRGMVEMDLIFGHFARCKLESLDASMLDEYDTLLKQLDSDLFRWLVMDTEVPPEMQALQCFEEVRRFIKEERTELLGPN